MQSQPLSQKKSKIGAVICVIGRQGSGKTPVTKRLADNSGFKNIAVYDPRREYDANKYTLFYTLTNFKKFLKRAKNTFIIVEEATGFIGGYKDLETWTDEIIGIQHKNNILVFIFHSLSDAPAYILRLSRFVVLLKTNDEAEVIKQSRPKFFKFMNKEGDQYIDVNNL